MIAMTGADVLAGVLVVGWACWRLVIWRAAKVIEAAPAAKLGRRLSPSRWRRFVTGQRSPEVRRWLRWAKVIEALAPASPFAAVLPHADATDDEWAAWERQMAGGE